MLSPPAASIVTQVAPRFRVRLNAAAPPPGQERVGCDLTVKCSGPSSGYGRLAFRAFALFAQTVVQDSVSHTLDDFVAALMAFCVFQVPDAARDIARINVFQAGGPSDFCGRAKHSRRSAFGIRHLVVLVKCG